MGERAPAVFTIPARRAFADALVAGLMRRHADDGLGLARGLILLPNNRARRAVTDAFVRASGGGLLLPRIAAIGDLDLDDGVDALLDPADGAIPPAVAPLQRRMILARLVAEERRTAGEPVDAAEAVRLAGELARTLDQLLVEEVTPAELVALDVGQELEAHWERALSVFRLVLDRWPTELARIGRIDAAARRGLLLDRLGERWQTQPPTGFVCAAGITDAAPAVARLLRRVAALPNGAVVFAGLDLDIADEEWDAIGPHPAPKGERARPSIETHPQFQTKLLLSRMGLTRDAVTVWRGGSEHDATLARGRAIATALAPADLTPQWSRLPAERRRLTGLKAAELATPAEEAQAIALALRGALEDEGRTAALVTPDRALARRVAAHATRWGIAVDDTAGRPLSSTPPGTLLTAMAEAAVERFAPVALLTLLKHPLARAGEGRLAWLEGARRLDRALRGPRPAAGLAGVDGHLNDPPEREARVRAAALGFWEQARALLSPWETVVASGVQPLGPLLAALREGAQTLCGDALWSGPAGRAAGELLAELEAQAGEGPALVDPATLPALLEGLMREVAVRPPQGGHPRLAIYGQIEARLQTADLMILGGLNEGVWPAAPAPDPWLAPRIRRELGLPGLERRIGVAAHDFAQALGAPEVLVTRARRDARQPAIASRFWRRLEALASDSWRERLRDHALEGWARELDAAGVPAPVSRPAPVPPPELRPKRIAVTDVDRLKADPFAFYAKRILRLLPLDPIDADTTAAWRGTAVHGVLEDWARHDDCAPDKLRQRAERLFDDERAHPLVRALWRPRLIEAIDWIAAEMERQSAAGRRMLAVEREGKCGLAGVELTGKFDRIDRMPDGALAIVDYKTGKPPSQAAIREGFSLQLGLLGLIVQGGGFEGIAGTPTGFEYWSLSRRAGGFGYVDSPTARKRDPIEPAEFLAKARAHFTAAADDWLTGDAPFEAKKKPEFAPYSDYDQLMRLDEWYGRERR